jgi:hypothetical protein
MTIPWLGRFFLYLVGDVALVRSGAEENTRSMNRPMTNDPSEFVHVS